MNNKYLKGSALAKIVLQNVNDIPPMPQILLKAREVLGNPDATFKELAGIIQTDQSIAMMLMRLSNSAFYNRGRSVSSLREAAVILGLKTIGELLLIASASRHLNKKLEGYSFTSGSLWRHSLTVACISKIIANKHNPAIANDAFSAGLIHDSGKIILDPYVTERKELFDMALQKGSVRIDKAEKQLFGFDHAIIAAKLCQKWNFPKHLSKAVQYHHAPSKIKGGVLSLIVHLADEVAIWCDVATNQKADSFVDEPMGKLGIKNESIERLLYEILDSGLLEEIQQLESMFIN